MRSSQGASGVSQSSRWGPSVWCKGYVGLCEPSTTKMTFSSVDVIFFVKISDIMMLFQKKALFDNVTGFQLREWYNFCCHERIGMEGEGQGRWGQRPGRLPKMPRESTIRAKSAKWMVRGETGGSTARRRGRGCSVRRTGIWRGTSTGCFMCKEISRLGFDRFVIRYRGIAHRRNSKKRGD